MNVLAIEAATSHAEVAVLDGDGVLAHEIEEIGHGHTQRLTPLVARALERAGRTPMSLAWIAADLGPGSFTGVRVGLATAAALALGGRARTCGASSLASLAHGVSARRALIAPLVPAGRLDAYLGLFRADARGEVRLLAAPRVGPLDPTLAAIEEARAAAGVPAVIAIGPGAARWREALESRWPGSTAAAHRFEGLSALDLARAARLDGGPAAGLAPVGAAPEPLYVRSAQAEERVRRRAHAREPVTLRPFADADLPAVCAIEERTFSDPWPAEFFAGELRQPLAYARIAERGGRVAGYSVSWLGEGSGHLGNLAVAPGERRKGIGRVLVEDLLDEARRRGVESLSLEVRVSNDAGQALYRAHGFKLAGLRRGYYRDTGEDALLMEWRPEYGASRHAGAPEPRGTGGG